MKPFALPRTQLQKAVKVQASEADISRSIQQYLTLRGIFWRRRNVGAMKAGERFIRFASPGEADIWGILPTGQHFEIEVKRPDGRLNLAQKAFMQAVLANKAVHIIARDLQTVVDFFEAWK